MTIEPGYPVTLVHPAHKPATIAEERTYGSHAGRSTPEMFPSVTVNGANDEAAYRARGYIRYGEAPPMTTENLEYPKYMRHPAHVPAVEPKVDGKIEEGRLVTFTVPGTPAVMPDVIVTNKREEEKYIKLGYAAPKFDLKAHEAQKSSLGNEVNETGPKYPRWENGKMVTDPDAFVPDPSYPRYEDGVLIYDPRVPPAPDPTKYPMWIHPDNKPSENSVMVKSPTEEREFWAKWKETHPEPDQPELKLETKPDSVLDNVAKLNQRRKRTEPPEDSETSPPSAA